jgi:hypothetical protein
MAHLARHHFDSSSYERPRRRSRSRVWAFVRRYQLVELFLMIGSICIAWLGASFGYNYL